MPVLLKVIEKEVKVNKQEEELIIDIWNLEIPKINLYAVIEDGTSDEILNRSIAHFENTGYSNGNIALAAHNRGYKVNYFENIKYLEKGDEIYYCYKNEKQKYIVDESKIIKETQIEVLESTNENIITLITCVENRPEYRRCIIGKKV